MPSRNLGCAIEVALKPFGAVSPLRPASLSYIVLTINISPTSPNLFKEDISSCL